MAANPPTMYHRTLSSRAGRVVRLAAGAAAPDSAREFTEGFCASSAAESFEADGGMRPVPEIEKASSVLAATDCYMKTLNPCCCPAAAKPSPETCIPGGAKIATRSIE